MAPVAARIESAFVSGREVSSKTPIRVPAVSKSIGFTYGETNLAFPARIRFRYWLDGSGQGWSDAVATKQVVFSNLDPGNYVFRIVASNSAGLWNGPETSVTFLVEPSFWQTWWFRFGSVIICCLAIMALYRLRMSQMVGRLNVRFHDRLAERTRIAQDLHDTLLQGVLSASMQLDLAEEHVPADSPAKPLLRRVLELMRQVTEEGRHALKGLRAADIKSPSLESALSRLSVELFTDSGIEYRVVIQGTPRPLQPVVRDEIYRIGREAVNNAFIHAKPSAVQVEVEYASRFFRLVIRDDGQGIDPSVLKEGREGHWGLSGMRERSEAIGAELTLRSRVGSGTELELMMPGKIAFLNTMQRSKTRRLPQNRKSLSAEADNDGGSTDLL
jgi:hypothetical protein